MDTQRRFRSWIGNSSAPRPDGPMLAVMRCVNCGAEQWVAVDAHMQPCDDISGQPTLDGRQEKQS